MYIADKQTYPTERTSPQALCGGSTGRHVGVLAELIEKASCMELYLKTNIPRSKRGL